MATVKPNLAGVRQEMFGGMQIILRREIKASVPEDASSSPPVHTQKFEQTLFR